MNRTFLAALLLAQNSLAAAPDDAMKDRTSAAGPSVSERTEAGLADTFWVVGVAVERFGSNRGNFEELDAPLIGLSAQWRIAAFAPHVLALVAPTSEGYQETRALGGLGIRAYVEIPGFTEMSYGVGTHIEARLADHFWLAYMTPLELGATLYRKNSWHLELFVGARRVYAGKLIDHFLIDPNGVENENAQDALDRERYDQPWKGFVRLVFGRRID